MTLPAVRLRRPPSFWIAGFLLVLALVMVGSEIVLSLAIVPDAPPDESDLVPTALAIIASLVSFLSLPIVGAILAIRRPHNPVGWLLLASGVGIISGTLLPDYVARSLNLGADLPGHRVADWIGYAPQNLAFAILSVWIPLLFPEGHLASPRWRPIAWVAAISMAVSVLTGLVIEHPNLGRRLPNPVAIGEPARTVTTVAFDASTILMGGLVVVALVSVVVRFRRSRNADREQLKWFLAAAGVLALAVAVLAVTQAAWAFFALTAAFALLPVSIGIAILRYRLYEIDRIVSRTISWAMVTVSLVGMYLGGVLVLQGALSGITQGDTLAVAGSTLVAAAAFQPLRRRIQALVDRRFHRTRYDAELTAAAFAEQLRGGVDMRTIAADFGDAAQAAVAPTTLSVWVRDPRR